MIDITGKKYIIFDFDKTLFWLDLDWDHYFDDIESYMRELDPNLFESYIRDDISWGDMQNAYVEQFGSSILDKLIDNSRLSERRLLNKAVPNEEVIELVKQLDSDITLSIWSSNSKQIIEDILAGHGLLERFKTIVSRSSVDMLKPSPEGFFKTYDSLADRSNYLMIGNSEADRLGAARANIDFHLVTMPQFRS